MAYGVLVRFRIVLSESVCDLFSGTVKSSKNVDFVGVNEVRLSRPLLLPLVN